MPRVRRFLALSGPERRLLLRAAGLVAAARLGLWLLPFHTVHRGARELARRRSPRREPWLAPEHVVWAVTAAGRVVPRTTCLVRALAAQVLLGSHGYPSDLRLGAARGAGRPFEAHAWLECDGRVLIGGPIADRYARFPSLEMRS